MRIFDKTLHKSCFRCNSCSKVLEKGEFIVHNNELACRICFAKKFATKGYDFGIGALSLEIKSISPCLPIEKNFNDLISGEVDDYRSVLKKKTVSYVETNEESRIITK